MQGRGRNEGCDNSLTIAQITMRMFELTLVTNTTTNDNRWELNITKKYAVASSRIVRRIPGRPPGSDSPVANDKPVPKLTKTTTEKAMASGNGVRAEGGVAEDVGVQLPKNSEIDMYVIPMRGDLA